MSDYKKDLVLVAKDDLAYGVERHFYPKFDARNVDLVSYDDRDALSKIPFHGSCRPSPNCLYAWDRYSDSYVQIMNERQEEVDNSDIFASSMCQSIRGALMRMGAKRISTEQGAEYYRSADTNVNAGGGNIIARANVDVRYSDDNTSRYKQVLVATIPQNKPVPISEVEDFINVHGLRGSFDFENLLYLMKQGCLSGHTYNDDIEVFKEFNTLLDIAVGLDIKLLGFKAGFKRKTRSTSREVLHLSAQF